MTPEDELVAQQDNAYNIHRPRLTLRDLDLQTKLDIVCTAAKRTIPYKEVAVRFSVKERVVIDLMHKLKKKHSYFIK